MNYYQTQEPAVVHFQTLGLQGLLRRVLELVWHQKKPVLLQIHPEHRVWHQMLPGLGLLQMVQEQVSSQNAQQLEWIQMQAQQLELIHTVLELGWSRMLGQPRWQE
jgi:hypothetical protein